MTVLRSESTAIPLACPKKSKTSGMQKESLWITRQRHRTSSAFQYNKFGAFLQAVLKIPHDILNTYINEGINKKL